MKDKSKIVDPSKLIIDIDDGYKKPTTPDKHDDTDRYEKEEVNLSNMADSYALSGDITAEEYVLKKDHEFYMKTHPHEFKKKTKIKDTANDMLKKFFDRNNFLY